MKEYIEHRDWTLAAEVERDIVRERVKAGIASAWEKGNKHGRTQTAAIKKDEVKKLYKNGNGMNKSQIAKKLKLVVRRLYPLEVTRLSEKSIT